MLEAIDWTDGWTPGILQSNWTLKFSEIDDDVSLTPKDVPAAMKVLLTGATNITCKDGTILIVTGGAARYIPFARVQNVQEPK